MDEVLFELGRLVITTGTLNVLEDELGNPDLVVAVLSTLLKRHQRGDWGDVDDDDRRENDFSVKNGFRVLSAYTIANTRLWVITEADRSVTTVLLPSEY